MVTAEEIESKIVRLHEEGKTSKFISAAVHKNFTYIGTVLKRNFPEEYTETDNGIITKETQALKLFSLRKTPTQAAIELNETPDSIEKYFMDYWHLQHMFSLYKIYRENRKAVPSLLRLHNLLEKKRIRPNMYNDVADLIEQQMYRADDPVLKSRDIKHMSEEQALKSDRYLEWLESGFPKE
jgi:hypothetical protein